ncbi:unnamed protein product [Amoebophrya sp. A120]|nr:unnamed protein product [Amoebophrya sp. A120]|eukprot:GSA120T00002847001.1
MSQQKGGSSSSSPGTLAKTPSENFRPGVFYRRLGNDVAAAALATLALSPFVCVIDKSIISNASGRQSLGSCLSENFRLLFTRPHRFALLPEYHLIYGVYLATYMSANMTDTICKEHGINPLSPVFFATSATNMGFSIMKDRAFTRMFSTLKSPKPLPLLSYALFAVRDSLTILGSFTLVPFAGKKYFEWMNDDSNSSAAAAGNSSSRTRPAPLPVTALAASPGGTNSASGLQQSRKISQAGALNLAQLTCPMLIQLVSTPLHLTALDLYNRPQATAGSRLAFVGSQYLGAMTLRMSRIAPAFGFGGLGNRILRESFNAELLEPAIPPSDPGELHKESSVGTLARKHTAYHT